MAETQSIERKGREILRKHLEAKGRKVEESDDRTFDLKVTAVQNNRLMTV